ncbi:hypothetical protein N7537_008273 [Penicillium hordei]|uniref:Uncharacterized protein n=1 Tax=Penicillium hordei TaxID=40994 RepID=A0AAD6H0P8_9EURO|nr:uncharacterized protein N7537_008273 [Penicillium hordei]KAJ5598189.1 hypothetical protein N7537_008273 [Penicillium hordei]
MAYSTAFADLTSIQSPNCEREKCHGMTFRFSKEFPVAPGDMAGLPRKFTSCLIVVIALLVEQTVHDSIIYDRV